MSPHGNYAVSALRAWFCAAVAIPSFALHGELQAQTVNLAAWNFTGQSAVVTSTATASDSNFATVPILIRGPGAAASTGNNSFRTTGFQNNGIALSNSDYFEVSLTAAANFSMSLASIDARFAGTAGFAAAPGVSNQFAYSLDGTTFTLVGTPTVVVGSPATMPQVDLSGVAALQSVPTGTTVVLRFYASGQTTTGGWGFNSPDASTDGLVIRGSITSASPNAPTITGFSPEAGSAGTVVTVTGTNFVVGGTTVRFGTVEASAVTVSGSTSLTASVPAGATTARILVTTADGTATSASDFVILDGSGTATVQNGTVGSPFADRNLFGRAVAGQTLQLVYAPPTAGTVEGVSVTLPEGFTGLSQANVGVSGGGGTPSVSVSGQTATISGLAATSGNNVTINLAGLSTPDTATPITNSGSYTINVSSRGFGGTLTPITTLPTARVLIPIANAQNRDPGNGYLPALFGQTVAVEGVCTVGKLANVATNSALQDETHGIVINSTIVQGPQTRGNRYVAVGPIANFRGLAQISLATTNDLIDLGPAVDPGAVTVTVPEFTAIPVAFSYQSRVVRIENLTKVSGNWAVNDNVVLQDDNANQLAVRIVANSTATAEPTYPVTITGVAGQFGNTTAPFDTGFQLQPRDPADLQPAGGPNIGVNPTSLNLSAFTGQAGTAQSVTVTGTSLSADITAAVDSPEYEVASGSGAFGAQVTLPASGGTVQVRIKPGATAGPVEAANLVLRSGPEASRVETLVPVSGTRISGGGGGLEPGLQSFTSDLNFTSTARFVWVLRANTTDGRGTEFSGVNVGGNLGVAAGAAFDIVLNGAGSTTDFSTDFWKTARSWPVFNVTGSTTGSFTLGAITADSGGRAFNTYGSFALRPGAGGGVFLDWQPGVTPTNPTVTTSVSSLNAFTATQGTPSSAQSFTVSGVNLSANITVTAPANYEISLAEGGPYASVVTVPQSGGSAGSTLIFVRIASSSASGGVSGNVTAASAGAATQSVAVSGTVSAAGTPTIIATPATLPSFTTSQGTASTPQNFNASGSNLTAGNLTVTAPAGFEVALAAGGPYGPTATLTPVSGTLASTPVFVRIAASTPQGSLASRNVTIVGGGATAQNIAVSGNVSGAGAPTISPANNTAFSGFTTVVGMPSTNQSFNLSGSNLTTNITLTPPPGWQVAATNTTTFTTSPVTIATNPAGVVSNTPIFVRLAGTNAAATNYPSSILRLASGTLTNNVLLSGSVTTAATPTISPTNNTAFSGFTTVRGTNSTNQVFTLSGSNLTTNITLTPPAGWQIATNTNNFTASAVTIATNPAGVVSNTSIFVRLAGTNAAATNYPNSALPLVSGALTNNVLLSGAVTDPTPVISSSTNALTNFMTSAGTFSTNQVVQVGGQNLQGPIAIAAPADFEVSLDGLTFSDGVVLDGTVARDVASNYAGDSLAWTNNSDGGFGFAPWVITNSPPNVGFAGNFIGNPQVAGVQGMAANSFGLFANPTSSGAFVNTSRRFEDPLQAGQTFSFQWGVNFDSGGSDSVKGFDVLVDTTTVINVDIGGFQAPLRFNETDTGIAFGNQAMTWTFTVDAPGNLRVTSTARTNSSQVVFTTNIPVAAPPTGFAFYAFQMAEGPDRQPYFNDLKITKPAAEIEPRDVYVRIKEAAPVGSVSGNLTATSPNAAPRTVALSGTVNVPPPTLAATPPALSGLRAFVNQAGSPGSFQLIGSNLTGPVTVTATANFEVSLTSVPSGFASSLTLSPSAGGVDRNIFVRIAAGASQGPVTGGVTLGSAGATDVQVPVSGEVTLAAPIVELISPVDGTVVRPGKKVALRAEVETTGTTSVISRFEFLANGAPIDNFPSPEESPFVYELEWEPAEGVYAITGQATDAVGAVGDSVSVELIVRPEQEGEPLDSFVPPSANGAVQALAADAVGRIYVGGSFSRLQPVDSAGEPVGDPAEARGVARLTSEGAIDPSFHVGQGPNGAVQAMVHTPEGLLVAGDFTKVDGVDRVALARLGTSGALEMFNAGLGASASPNPTLVQALLVQPDDGKILIGGSFDQAGGAARSNLARLHADGSLDEDFNVPVDGVVNSIALQTDGKILIGGSFSAVHGVTSRRIARLEADGRLDVTFITRTGSSSGFNATVQSVAVTPEGRIYVAGAFTSYRGANFYRYLAQLRPDGTIEAPFNYLGGLNLPARRVLVVPGTEDALVAGEFTTAANTALWVGSRPAGSIALFESTGELSADFNPAGAGANGPVNDALELPDGNWLLAGNFTTFNGEPRAGLVVLAGPNYGRGFAAWAAGWGLAGLEAEPDAVLNASGISNLMVYALGGGDPRQATPAILPQAEWLPDMDGYRLSLRAPRTSRAPGIEYLGEHSQDLRSWSTEGVQTGFVPPDNDLLILAPQLLPGQERQFLRLKVLQP